MDISTTPAAATITPDLEPSADRGQVYSVAFTHAGRSYRAARFVRNGQCAGTELYLVSENGLETFLRYTAGSWGLDTRANHLARQAEVGSVDRPLELI